jgi:hypothetical protein
MHAVHPHVAYWNALLWLAFFVLITIIIAELKVLYLRERRLSRVDTLTGVATLLAFYEIAERKESSQAISTFDDDCLSRSRSLQRGKRFDGNIRLETGRS